MKFPYFYLMSLLFDFHFTRKFGNIILIFLKIKIYIHSSIKYMYTMFH